MNTNISSTTTTDRDDLARAVRNARFPGKASEALCKRLSFLSGFVQKGARLNDCQSDPHAVYILTQSRTLAPDVVVPFQSLLFSAMCRPQRDGSTPARFLEIDELAKLMGHPIFAGRLRETGQDRRHHRTSVSGATQFVAGLDPTILTLPTVVVVFRVASVLEVRALKDRFGYLRGIPDEVFLTLGRGECVIAATFSTGETNAYVVRIRPKVTRAGGCTLRTF